MRTFLWWTGERWELEAPDGSLTGVWMYPASDSLLPPEAGQLITVFFRWVPGQGNVIDYWIEAVFIPSVAFVGEVPAGRGLPVIGFVAGCVALLAGGLVVFTRRKK